MFFLGGGAVYMVPPLCMPAWDLLKKTLIFFILEAVLLKLFIIFFRNFFSISLNFTNLKSSLNNIESIERLKVTASILIHNNTLQSFVWSSIALNIHVSHFENWIIFIFGFSTKLTHAFLLQKWWKN